MRGLFGAAGRLETVCARVACPTWSAGPSTSPLEGVMRAPVLAYYCVVCLLYGCGGPTASTPQAVAARAPEITSVVMHRSACFGPCPIYTVEILSTGDVRFDGQGHVKVPGHQTARIAPNDFGFLVQAIERVDFFNLHDQYMFKPDGCAEWWTDNPTVDIVVTRAGKKKHVSYYYGCRGLSVAKQIGWLSDTIDHVSNSGQWIGSGDAF